MSEALPDVVIVLLGNDGSALAEMHTKVQEVVKGHPIADVVNSMLTIVVGCIAQQAMVDPLDIDHEIDGLAAMMKSAVRDALMKQKGSRQ